MSSPEPSIPDVRQLAAPELLGGMWNWCLYGILIVQVYVYSYNFYQDNKYLKLFVYSIFLLETVQTALSGADLYYWFAAGFGHDDRLTTPYFAWFDTPIQGAIVSLSVQLFFVHRIWVLSKKRWWSICALICLFSTVDAAAGLTAGIYTHLHGKFATGRILKVIVLTWLGGNTISDVLIASAMLFHLSKLKTRAGNLSSHALVRIMRLTVETNVVTTTVSIVSLIIVSVYPNNNWVGCPNYVLGKLYSNTLLVSLNNRIKIRETNIAQGGVEVDASPSSTGSGGSETTEDFLNLDSEKQQEQTVNHPQTRIKVLCEKVINIV